MLNRYTVAASMFQVPSIFAAALTTTTALPSWLSQPKGILRNPALALFAISLCGRICAWYWLTRSVHKRPRFLQETVSLGLLDFAAMLTLVAAATWLLIQGKYQMAVGVLVAGMIFFAATKFLAIHLEARRLRREIPKMTPKQALERVRKRINNPF
jgi:hypothetical protein